MSASSPANLSRTRCPQCGASIATGSICCWLCHSQLNSLLDPQLGASAAESTPTPLDVSPRGFSLASLLLWMTLIALILGLFSIAPGLGLLAIIMAVPATLRTVTEIQRRKRLGQSTTIGEKALVFAASLGIVVIAGVAAAGAFSAACWGGFYASIPFSGDSGYGALMVGAVIGAVTGLIVGFWLFFRIMKAFRPRDPQPPPSATAN